MEFITPYGSLRLLIFGITFLVLATLECFTGHQKRKLSRRQRWVGNIGLSLLATLLIRVIFPMGSVGIALWAAHHHYGLFNWWGISQHFLAFLAGVILLDLAIYAQHVFVHKLPYLWRFHYIHHSDPDVDVSNALRFHPVEIILSMGYKAILTLTLGISPAAVLTFEILLNSMALFNHSNIHLPPKLEKALRVLFITPQMHIIHHSWNKSELHSNFGFNFSLWDKIFRTYTLKLSSPSGEAAAENPGVPPKTCEQTLRHLLVAPLTKGLTKRRG